MTSNIVCSWLLSRRDKNGCTQRLIMRAVARPLRALKPAYYGDCISLSSLINIFPLDINAAEAERRRHSSVVKSNAAYRPGAASYCHRDNEKQPPRLSNDWRYSSIRRIKSRRGEYDDALMSGRNMLSSILFSTHTMICVVRERPCDGRARGATMRRTMIIVEWLDKASLLFVIVSFFVPLVLDVAVFIASPPNAPLR